MYANTVAQITFSAKRLFLQKLAKIVSINEIMRYHELYVTADAAPTYVEVIEIRKMKESGLAGCLPEDIVSQCLQSNDRYDECTRDLCSRCILQASVLNPFGWCSFFKC
ncbi:unnamed protein product [Litomosoides sigmodontis]|uniref:Uncharacterized protein n=1 Tax=Litomosoides sigmodontis TaxID=42156 RepID=A0A3P6TUP8_LITSI|nr:unnamed protein product [Litomosoides sigmodontis]